MRNEGKNRQSTEGVHRVGTIGFAFLSRAAQEDPAAAWAEDQMLELARDAHSRGWCHNNPDVAHGSGHNLYTGANR